MHNYIWTIRRSERLICTPLSLMERSINCCCVLKNISLYHTYLTYSSKISQLGWVHQDLNNAYNIFSLDKHTQLHSDHTLTVNWPSTGEHVNASLLGTSNGNLDYRWHQVLESRNWNNLIWTYTIEHVTRSLTCVTRAGGAADRWWMSTPNHPLHTDTICSAGRGAMSSSTSLQHGWLGLSTTIHREHFKIHMVEEGCSCEDVWYALKKDNLNFTQSW